MFFRRYGTFTGGIDLPEEKHQTLDSAIQPCGRLDRLRVPLAPCGHRAAEPVVEPGRRVVAGEKIASGNGEGVDIFAPLSGRVVSISTACVSLGDSFVMSPAIELGDLSDPLGMTPMRESFQWRAADAETIRARIAEGGLTTHTTPLGQLAGWIEAARAKRCWTLVANIMENQPYVTSAHRLLVEHGGAVIGGLAILAHAMEAGHIVLAVDRRRTDDYRELVAPARAHRIDLTALVHKYPTGTDAMLVKVLTRREVPPGGGPMDVAVAVTDAATCLAAYRQVACGIPSTGRVVTVAGERASRPGNYHVPYGAACTDLADGQSAICGGPMVGLRCGTDCVVSPSTDAVLSIEADHPGRPGPCIRCGWCRDHCPARLNVADLNDAFELCLVEKARRAGAMACVECGVCSYVCPARLPLSRRTKQLKRAISITANRLPLFVKR